MRRLFGWWLGASLLSAVLGCHHVAGICDCGGPGCGCCGGGPLVHGPAAPPLESPYQAPPIEVVPRMEMHDSPTPIPQRSGL
jgi:hypothetical protein